VQRTAASIERGRDRYDIYCGLCHGVEGRGDGPVAPALANAVRDLTEQRMRDQSDGWMYAVIVNGFGALMPEYGSKISVEDRWHIVNYVRVLQGAAR
jgi:mono/diheme cytochrome c family protein